MVTAIHNPAADNGYKVYLGGADQGSQIVPPADAEIQATILRVARRLDRRPAALDRLRDRRRGRSSTRTSRATAVARPRRRRRSPTVSLRLHADARRRAARPRARVFADAGFPDMHVVTEQVEPDPDFPTVAFPNPEEPGAMDLAFATAPRVGRRAGHRERPGRRPRRGRRARRDGRGRLAPPLGQRGRLAARLAGARSGARRRIGTLACSLVSSPALGGVAAHHGLDWVETLTGFKWISRAPGLVFGYEEALGYLVDPEKVRDKDGISAAVAVLGLFASLKASGITFEQHLAAFAEKFGGYASSQISIRVADLSVIPATMAALRATPPAAIGGRDVVGVDDFEAGIQGFPPNDILRLPVRRRPGHRAALGHRAEAQVLPGRLVDRRRRGGTAGRRAGDRRGARRGDAGAARAGRRVT